MSIVNLRPSSSVPLSLSAGLIKKRSTKRNWLTRGFLGGSATAPFRIADHRWLQCLAMSKIQMEHLIDLYLIK